MSATSSASAAPAEAARSPSRGQRFDREGARSGSRVGTQFDDRHAQLLCDRAGGRVDATLDEQGLRLQVVQVELELVGAVRRIERRGRGSCGDGDKRRCHVRAVAEDDRHAVVPADAERVEPIDRAPGERAKPGVGQRRLIERCYCGGFVTPTIDERDDRLKLAHRSSEVEIFWGVYQHRGEGGEQSLEIRARGPPSRVQNDR